MKKIYLLLLLSINPARGDSIEPIINSFGDTLKTGVPVPARGRVIDPKSVAKPKVIPAGKPKVFPTTQNVHKIPENLTVIPVNKDSLKTFTPGVDTSSFVLVNSAGDTIPIGVPIPAKGKVVPCRQTQPVKALPPRMKDNASVNIKYLDVEQGMNSTQVTSILEDNHGNLWFGAINQGVSMYNGETFTHYTTEEGLSRTSVSSILEDSHGNLWIGTYGGGVSMYNGETFTHFTEKEGLCNNFVLSMLEDSHGNLWFATRSGGVSMYNGESFTHFTPKEGFSYSFGYSMLEDRHGNIWFGTQGGGVSIYNGNTFTHLTQKQGLINDRVWSILEDRFGNIWIGTDEGVSMYDGETLTHFTEKEGLSDNIVRSMLEDSHGNLWFGTNDGVSMYNGESFTHFTQNEGLSGKSVRVILKDSNGNLWFGFESGGVSIYYGTTFTHFTQREGLSVSGFMHILEDSHGNLWFSSRGGGVSMYNGETFIHFTIKEGLIDNVVTVILENSQRNLWFGTRNGLCKYNGKTFTHLGQNEGLSDNNIQSMLEDSHGNIWIGTQTGGVSMYNGKYFTHFTQSEIISDNIIRNMMEDSHGNIWIGTQTGGVSMYNGKTFTHFTEKEGLCDNLVRAILEDSQGNLWFGTEGGVNMYNGETLTHFTEKEGLCDNHIRDILEDSQGNLWFYTLYGGVSMYNGETFTHFSQKEGLSDNEIRSMLEDSNNNIWLSTGNGLNRLVFEQESDSVTINILSSQNPVIHTYGLQDGLKGIGFLPRSVLLDSKKRIWWGTFKGLTMLDINDLKEPVEPPVMHLNRIDINGHFVDYRHLDDSNGLKMEFNGVARFYNYPLNLELPHNRNNLTFHFSAIDWSASQKLNYSYVMEGLDDQWNAPTAEAYVEYRNMPYGRYTFKVRAIGAAQKWSEPFEYTFRVLPPPWLTWWAYLIYGFILLILIRWYRGFLIRREKINADLRVKEMEMNKMQELDHIKSRFFANISHEFRTPLTLLLGPIEDSLKTRRTKIEADRGVFEMMRRNAKRLQRLINQMLDISRLESGKMNVQVSEGDLTGFVRTISSSFLSLAESKKITYHINLQETDSNCFFDPDKVEKILTNLLSNAFKYTPQSGTIKLNLDYKNLSDSQQPESVIFKIKDTGIGISKDQLSKIFDRFYQVGSVDTHEDDSMGIGLALTRELVDLLRGTIEVDSEIGIGTTFTLILPVSESSFSKEERVETSHYSHEVQAVEKETVMAEQPGKVFLPEVLIVEDNQDLRSYISQQLRSQYSILEAVNGREGLNMAVERIPDLIISDLMMPEMGGMEMCRELKADPRTSHIPIIMLTAKADRRSKLEGLETGADDYIIKPFDAEELKVRTKNLIEQRRKLREKFREEFRVKPFEETVRVPEDKLLRKALDILRQNMADPEYNVDLLPAELNMSRSQMFRKIGALTGGGPSELLRIMRLKKAAELILSGKQNITEIMYEVGFQTPSYFARSFREYFGMNPSEYKRSVVN